MKEKIVRYVLDRTGTVDHGYDCTILAVKHARFGDAGWDADHTVWVAVMRMLMLNLYGRVSSNGG